MHQEIPTDDFVVDVHAILAQVRKLKGQFKRVVYARDCRVLKGAPRIRKVTIRTVRAGINYENMKVVQEGRVDGTLPCENQGLSFGEWEEFPYLIKHGENRYVRLYPKQGDVNTITGYFINHEQVEYDVIEHHLNAQEKRPDPICIQVKLDNLVEID